MIKSEAMRRPDTWDRGQPLRHLVCGVQGAQPPVERVDPCAERVMLCTKFGEELAGQGGNVGRSEALEKRFHRRKTLGCNQAELAGMAADRIGELGLLTHKPLALSHQHQRCLLVVDLTGTKRMVGRLAASHNAAASAASFLPRAT